MTTGSPHQDGTIDGIERRVIAEMNTATVIALRATFEMLRSSQLTVSRIPPRSNLDQHGMSWMRSTSDTGAVSIEP